MHLQEIIEHAETGELILPNFQRGFKWRAENIRQLLESLIANYPVGSVLLWQTNEATFGARCLQGVTPEENDEVEDEFPFVNDGHGIHFKYILDGQQRLTSIFKIFGRSINVSEPETQIFTPLQTYRFFLDLKLLNFPNPTIENYQDYTINFPDDIDTISEACVVKNFRTIRGEFNHFHNENLNTNIHTPIADAQLIALYKHQLLLPLSFSFLQNDNNLLNSWISEKAFVSSGGNPNIFAGINQIFQDWLTIFNNRIQLPLIQRSIPINIIPEDTSTEGLIRIFETINSTGLSLSSFDLLAARLSNTNFNNNIIGLRKLIFNTLSSTNLSQFDDMINLGDTACRQLPRIFALIHANQINIEPNFKKSAILTIPIYHLENIASLACTSLDSSLNFLRTQVGVRNKNFLPFKDAITLSAIVHENEINRYKAFYWLTLFTKQNLDKDSNATTRNLYDEWLTFRELNANDAVNHINIFFNPNEDIDENQQFPNFEKVLRIKNRSSLLYRAFLTFAYSNSTIDWAGIDVHNPDIIIEDHHIYPKQWFGNNIPGIAQHQVDLKNTILNRVIVSITANRNAVNQGAGNASPYAYLNNYNFNNLNEFLIPESFRLNNPTSINDLIQMYHDRYLLMRTKIYESIINLVNN